MSDYDRGPAAPRTLLTRLRWAALLEGATLVLLLLVAVPIKHLGGEPRLVSILGPLHGLAFLVYLWLLLQTVGAGLWTRREAWRLALACLLPLGTWVNDSFVRKRRLALTESDI